MEYAEGGELFDYIVKNTKYDLNKNLRLKEVEACRYFQ